MARRAQIVPRTPRGASRVQTLGRLSGGGETPSPKAVSPFKELGTAGVAVFGGRVMTPEKDYRVTGNQRWVTFADLCTNTSIVAAGVRYFLNVIAYAKWTLEPADESAQAKQAAELVDSIINDMDTPWSRVMRRASMYRFNGFGFQEWTAKKRPDGKIGLQDIEARPCHTLDRWEVDDGGTVLGFWQRSPQTGQVIWLPRQKLLYLVEDSLTDSPEGLGLFRHMVDPYLRLKRYENLEGLGYDRDLRGIPIGRVPYTAIKQAVKAGNLTEEEGRTIITAVEDFVQMQTKKEDTSIVLDSAPYMTEGEGGVTFAGTMQFGIELLQGQQPGFGELNNALQRLNRELARIIGVEHLLLGESSGSRALSEDKSRNFYLVANGTLDEIADGCDKDIIERICDLNGIAEEMRPKLTHSDVSFRAVSEVVQTLTQLASAGAVLRPDDPAIDDVRKLVGLPEQPEISADVAGMLARAGQGQQPGQEEGEQEQPDGKGKKGVEGVQGAKGAKGTESPKGTPRTPPLPRKRPNGGKRPAA